MVDRRSGKVCGGDRGLGASPRAGRFGVAAAGDPARGTLRGGIGSRQGGLRNRDRPGDNPIIALRLRRRQRVKPHIGRRAQGEVRQAEPTVGLTQVG
jgi:hypothetical protein